MALPGEPRIVSRARRSYYTFPALESEGFLVAFTTRTGGSSPAPFASLNLGFGVGDDASGVLRNRELAAADLGIDPGRLVGAEQVHGADLAWVGEPDAGRGARSRHDAVAGRDGLLSDAAELPLILLFADCVPLVLINLARRRLAAVHAGRRGIELGIVRRAAGALTGVDAAVIGPAIGGCCYEVERDMARKLDEHAALSGMEGFALLDLPSIVKRELIAQGVSSETIHRVDRCTACHKEEFYSYRAQGGRTGRHALIASRLW